MSLAPFTAFATTREIIEGERAVQGAAVTLRGQRFVDAVASSDPRVAGTNRLSLDLVVHPGDGSGTVRGAFEWTTEAGAWRGELAGVLVGGMVRATGVARGEGGHAGAVLRADWQQVSGPPSGAPAEPALAFFTVEGAILS